jgi:hypothetical protein
MDLDDLTPAGEGSLRRPVLGPHRVPVAQFTHTQTTDPAELWQPFTRTTDATRGGIQGAPLGGPGHGIEHKPLDQAEKQSQHLAQNVFNHAETASTIRSAPRPGF